MDHLLMNMPGRRAIQKEQRAAGNWVTKEQRHANAGPKRKAHWEARHGGASLQMLFNDEVEVELQNLKYSDSMSARRKEHWIARHGQPTGTLQNLAPYSESMSPRRKAHWIERHGQPTGSLQNLVYSDSMSAKRKEHWIARHGQPSGSLVVLL